MLNDQPDLMSGCVSSQSHSMADTGHSPKTTHLQSFGFLSLQTQKTDTGPHKMSWSQINPCRETAAY